MKRIKANFKIKKLDGCFNIILNEAPKKGDFVEIHYTTSHFSASPFICASATIGISNRLEAENFDVWLVKYNLFERLRHKIKALLINKC